MLLKDLLSKFAFRKPFTRCSHLALTMYADISKPPPSLPQSKPQDVGVGLRLLPPLSRLGHGPGIILLPQDSGDSLAIINGVPGSLIKWAEEGFAVIEIQPTALAGDGNAFKEAVEALKSCDQCDYNGKVGVVCE